MCCPTQVAGDRPNEQYHDHTCSRVAGNVKEDGKQPPKSAFKSKMLFSVLRDAEESAEGNDKGLTVNMAKFCLAPYTYAVNDPTFVSNTVKEYTADKRKKIMDPAHGSRVVHLCKHQETKGDYCKWLHQGGKKMREILLRNKQKRLDEESEDEEDPSARGEDALADESDRTPKDGVTAAPEPTAQTRENKKRKCWRSTREHCGT